MPKRPFGSVTPAFFETSLNVPSPCCGRASRRRPAALWGRIGPECLGTRRTVLAKLGQGRVARRRSWPRRDRAIRRRRSPRMRRRWTSAGRPRPPLPSHPRMSVAVVRTAGSGRSTLRTNPPSRHCQVCDRPPHAPAWIATPAVSVTSTNVPSPRLRHSSLRAPSALRRRNRWRVDQIHIQEPVLVVVEDGNAATHRLEDVFLVGRRDVREGNSACLRDVGERDLIRTGSPSPAPGVRRWRRAPQRYSEAHCCRDLADASLTYRHYRRLGIESLRRQRPAAIRARCPCDVRRSHTRLNSASAFSCSAVFPRALYAWASW